MYTGNVLYKKSEIKKVNTYELQKQWDVQKAIISFFNHYRKQCFTQFGEGYEDLPPYIKENNSIIIPLGTKDKIVDNHYYARKREQDIPNIQINNNGDVSTEIFNDYSNTGKKLLMFDGFWYISKCKFSKVNDELFIGYDSQYSEPKNESPFQLIVTTSLSLIEQLFGKDVTECIKPFGHIPMIVEDFYESALDAGTDIKILSNTLHYTFLVCNEKCTEVIEKMANKVITQKRLKEVAPNYWETL